MWSPCPGVTCVWLNTSLSSLSSLSPHCGSAQASSSSPPSRHNSMSALSQTPLCMRDGHQAVIICHLACYRWLPLRFLIGRGGSRDLNTGLWLDVSGRTQMSRPHVSMTFGTGGWISANYRQGIDLIEGFPEGSVGMLSLVLRPCIMGGELNKNGNLC